MYILVVGVNHKTAPVEIRERMTFTSGQLGSALKNLHKREHIDGCAILSTCNRTEIYAATTDLEKCLAEVKKFIKESRNLNDNDIRNYLYNKTLYDAVRHLFSVASGIDSMVLGETQILGQVKDAYESALKYDVSNNVINTFFQQALAVGKRVRTETLIDRIPVSISYVAVELARKHFKNFKKCKVLVIGVGEMSKLTAKHLITKGVSTVMVSNRSYDKAQQLAREFGGEAVKLSQLVEYMAEADIVISATAARHCIIHADDVKKAMAMRKGKTLVIIDIAVPRDVEPAAKNIEGVKLFDIDDLQYVVDKNLEERKKAALEAEEIINKEMEEFFKWLGSLFVVPTIVALRDRAEKIRQSELTRALNRLSPTTEREKKVLDSLTNNIVKQLLHDPIVNLKKYANTSQGHLYSEILQNLFNLEVVGQKKKRPLKEAVQSAASD